MVDHVLNATLNDGLHGETHWLAGAGAGVIAGLAFLMMEMALVMLVQGASPWGPPHMMAAMVLGRDVLPEPGVYAPFSMMIMLTAMAVHMVLSVLLGLAGAWWCAAMTGPARC